MEKVPKLQRVIRFDAVPVNQTYFTEEGYLIDHPIVTTVGIFEYHNADGSVRKELRLPEEVFSKKSLASYKGKPVIITHDAQVVNKDNVADEEIGTILSEGYKDEKDENNVRAEIIIHDTNAMKKSGLKELSLGYNLTLDETAGEWHGEHYDAIQRDIVINHLALVREARAGESARLNIDGKDKGMKKRKRYDGEPESLEEAVRRFKQAQSENEEPVEEESEEIEEKPVDEGVAGNGEEEIDVSRMREEKDADDEEEENINMHRKMQMGKPNGNGIEEETEVEEVSDEDDDEISDEDRIRMVKDRRDRRDEAGDPMDTKSAMGVIAQQDEDIDTLLKIIEKKKAKEDFQNSDGEGCGSKTADALGKKQINADSVDKIVSQKLELCRIADRLRMDGVEKMSIISAKKAIIKKIKPTINLDGKSTVYVDAMFDIAKSEISEKRTTDFQRRQMVNTDARDMNESAAQAARAKMMEKYNR